MDIRRAVEACGMAVDEEDMLEDRDEEEARWCGVELPLGKANRYHPPEYVKTMSWCSVPLSVGISIQHTVHRSSSMVSSFGAVIDSALPKVRWEGGVGMRKWA